MRNESSPVGEARRQGDRAEPSAPSACRRRDFAHRAVRMPVVPSDHVIPTAAPMSHASHADRTTNVEARTAPRRAAAARRGARAFAATAGSCEVARRMPTPVVRRGTHRTRVSEKRLVAAPIAASRPVLPGATLQRRSSATERAGGARVRLGTG